MWWARGRNIAFISTIDPRSVGRTTCRHHGSVPVCCLRIPDWTGRVSTGGSWEVFFTCPVWWFYEYGVILYMLFYESALIGYYSNRPYVILCYWMLFYMLFHPIDWERLRICGKFAKFSKQFFLWTHRLRGLTWLWKTYGLVWTWSIPKIHCLWPFSHMTIAIYAIWGYAFPIFRQIHIKHDQTTAVHFATFLGPWQSKRGKSSSARPLLDLWCSLKAGSGTLFRPTQATTSGWASVSTTTGATKNPPRPILRRDGKDEKKWFPALQGWVTTYDYHIIIIFGGINIYKSL